MSNQTMQTIIEKAIWDKKFAQALFDNPEQALVPYQNQLSPAEMATLKTMNPTMLAVMGEMVGAGGKRPLTPWWQPTSFKELGGSLLSLILMFLLLFAVFQTYRLITLPPLIISVGGNEQVVDTFERAQELLNMFFPLFSAVVTFWLGIAIESRRADRNEQDATVARAGQQQAEIDKNMMRSTASNALGKVMGIMAEDADGDSASVRSLEATVPRSDNRRRILEAIQEAQEALLE